MIRERTDEQIQSGPYRAARILESSLVMPNAQPHDTIAPAFVTVADACTYLSLSLPTLYRILGRKKLATAKAGRRTSDPYGELASVCGLAARREDQSADASEA